MIFQIFYLVVCRVTARVTACHDRGLKGANFSPPTTGRRATEQSDRGKPLLLMLFVLVYTCNCFRQEHSNIRREIAQASSASHEHNSSTANQDLLSSSISWFNFSRKRSSFKRHLVPLLTRLTVFCIARSGVEGGRQESGRKHWGEFPSRCDRMGWDAVCARDHCAPCFLR